MSGNESEICKFYQGKNILITGATGFMGKVLVEKLLRICGPNLGRLYLLLRTKQGQNPEERMQQYSQHKMFSHVSAECWSRVQAVEGDVACLELGLEAASRAELARHVHLIFHVAAVVRFDEPLRSAVLLNTRGTREVITLAKSMAHLQALVHVSTAYSHPELAHLEERVYPSPACPHEVISSVEDLKPNHEPALTKRLLQKLPNTYVFSKALAEALIEEASSHLPVVICRPSIVSPALREPFPGWADSRLGPTGMLVGAGTGLIRTAYGKRDIVVDLVPVDMAINVMLASAWSTATGPRSGCAVVFNCTTSSEAPITIERFLALSREVYSQYPQEQAFWFPGGSIQSSRVSFLLLFLLTQMLPALVCDLALLVMRRKTWLVRLQRRIYSHLRIMEFFLLHQWQFSNTRTRALLGHMSPRDRQLLDFDFGKLDYEEYIGIWTLGIRRYIMNQNDATIPAARAHYKRLYWLHVALQCVLLYLATWAVTSLVLTPLLGCWCWTRLITLLP